MTEPPWPDDYPHHKVTFPDARPPRRRGWAVVMAVFVFLAGLGAGRATAADQDAVVPAPDVPVETAAPPAVAPAPVLSDSRR